MRHGGDLGGRDGLLSPSKWASLDVYTDATAKAIAEALTPAELLFVDSSDLTPAQVRLVR
jgi:hypothetical protein